MRRISMMALAVLAATAAGCGNGELDTRTFRLEYIRAGEARQLILPYVYTDREGAPGALEVSGPGITVRETPDNLAKIERMLEQFDVPQPLTMLHFQIIRANGAAAADPEIAEVERELRRLFRFDGYELLAETQMAANEGALIRQMVSGGGQEFLIEGGVIEVRPGRETATVTLEVRLSTDGAGEALRTQVTAPLGHAVVLGTVQTRSSGALILVVRAERAGGGAPAPADSAAASTRG